jgi:hypothetical protein
MFGGETDLPSTGPWAIWPYGQAEGAETLVASWLSGQAEVARGLQAVARPPVRA